MGYYGFPKCRVEGMESDQETALREIMEETGLDVELVNGFSTEDHHTFTVANETKMKFIVYFLAEYSGQEPVAQEAELSSIHLMDYESAMDIFQFESSKRVLTEAHNYINR